MNAAYKYNIHICIERHISLYIHVCIEKDNQIDILSVFLHNISWVHDFLFAKPADTELKATDIGLKNTHSDS